MSSQPTDSQTKWANIEAAKPPAHVIAHIESMTEEQKQYAACIHEKMCNPKGVTGA